MRVSEYKLCRNRETAQAYLSVVREEDIDDDLCYANEGIDSMANFVNAWYSCCELAEENMYAIFLDSSLKVIGTGLVAQGTSRGTMVNQRGILLRALLLNANFIVVAHNHPSGSVKPSRLDKDSMMNLKSACEIVDIPLLDSIIVNGDSYFSFVQAGLL